MGLPLRNASLPIPIPGPPGPGGSNDISESGTDSGSGFGLSIIASGQPISGSRHTHSLRISHPRRGCLGDACGLDPDSYRTTLDRCSRSRSNFKPNSNNKHHDKLRRRAQLARNSPEPSPSSSHDASPRRSPWSADADEGCVLARSTLALPGEDLTPEWGSAPRGSSEDEISPSSQSSQSSQSSTQSRRSRRRSGGGSGGSQDGEGEKRRPPSLERQDAFRDEKTAKKPPQSWATPRVIPRNHYDDDNNNNHNSSDNDEDIAELYRLGVLYDDVHERGSGFSLAQIDHVEPTYSLRVRPQRSRRRAEEREEWGGREGDDWYHEPSGLSAVDLAVSAFGEDERVAGWLLSGTSSFSQTTSMPSQPQSQQRTTTQHDGQLVTVIYELEDDDYHETRTIPAASEDNSLDLVSLSSGRISLSDYDMAEDVMMTDAGTEAESDVDPWVVLGPDGS
ncbi:uncharacterized protein C8A04DRAFT_12628 [Dichotomopilus funicola]|uniref:Uncharacterized protein n=1 Tax=Dichotomopilus funicola TaxID=1934379 RepID=A0AAN6V1M0_9PEZI|nr:hypothetical protein C8A04DRAFT_12628 [Dichotomopilus funicola]